MTIRFLRDHEVEGPPVESFEKGQEVKDRSPESELHFVRRGHAAFVRGGKLYDHEDRLVDEAALDTPPPPPLKEAARPHRAPPRNVTGAKPAKAPKPAKPAKTGDTGDGATTAQGEASKAE